MPFNHYHPLLLRQVPGGARTALDVGCGTGRFARHLAATGLAVDGIDPDPAVISAARALGGGVGYRQADVTTADLREGHYDFISCLASLHHVPFATVTKLRQALAPGGVLAVLGLGKPRSAADLGKWLVLGPPVNLAARAIIAAGERLNGGPDQTIAPRVRGETMTMTEVRRESARLLPGSTVRPLLFWRYLLLYRGPAMNRT
ncbi:class I SAM-dependent methyltransferase [Amycolatopsis alkalitolerans]|uniref:Class I SAM-dependent methyltransferase n=1 Tax=Amycolatopsis alkalitolerans TaxID=2547244 RepID=A0A5C4M399_9PSEU|nr:class I SAM-dependent methyltransferase [Amycolatopsis alkalitolerans]TNC24377.1 class I SAM-dependent methyltransferase [Amycolatopsis alkalitolerans]